MTTWLLFFRCKLEQTHFRMHTKCTRTWARANSRSCAAARTAWMARSTRPSSSSSGGRRRARARASFVRKSSRRLRFSASSRTATSSSCIMYLRPRTRWFLFLSCTCRVSFSLWYHYFIITYFHGDYVLFYLLFLLFSRSY